MAHRRNQAFLATKTKERTRDGSMRMIEKSLQLLQTDHVDLWQLHDIGTMSDVERGLRQGRRHGSAARDEGAEGCALSRPHRPLPPRRADGRHPPLSIRHDPDGHECGRSAPLQLQRGTAAARRRKTDGHYRHEDPRPRPPAIHLDAAASLSAGAHVGRHGAGADTRHADHARGHVLYAFAAGQHRHHRLRLDRAARRECESRAGVHAAQRSRRLLRSWRAPSLSPSRLSSSASTTGPETELRPPKY